MDQADRPDTFLTVAEVAGILKLNQQTVRNWIDQGSLPALRVGRRVRIRRSDFERILAEGYTGRSDPSSSSRASGQPGGSATPSSSGASGHPSGSATPVPIGAGAPGHAGTSGGPGTGGGAGASGASVVSASTGQGSGPTAEDFWGGEAIGLAPATANPATPNAASTDPAVGNGNPA